MKTLLFALTAFATAAHANMADLRHERMENLTFSEARNEYRRHFDEKISGLQTARACVDNAISKDELRRCQARLEDTTRMQAEEEAPAVNKRSKRRGY